MQHRVPQDVLVEIVDRSDLHLELKVFERDIARVKVGQRILFKIPSRGSNDSDQLREICALRSRSFGPHAAFWQSVGLRRGCLQRPACPTAAVVAASHDPKGRSGAIADRLPP